MYGYTALSWSGPNSTHPHCADRLVFKVGRWLCISRADRCIVYRENVYNRLHFSAYTEKWGLLGRAELRVGGGRTPAFLSSSYYAEAENTPRMKTCSINFPPERNSFIISPESLTSV